MAGSQPATRSRWAKSVSGWRTRTLEGPATMASLAGKYQGAGEGGELGRRDAAFFTQASEMVLDVGGHGFGTAKPSQRDGFLTLSPLFPVKNRYAVTVLVFD